MLQLTVIQTFTLTHDVQDVVGYLSGSDSALLGVSLQDLQHGLQLVQSAVLTLLAYELPTDRLENKHTLFITFSLAFSNGPSFLISLFPLPSFLSFPL